MYIKAFEFIHSTLLKATIFLSHLLQTVLARCRVLALNEPAGRMNSFKGPTISTNLSIFFSTQLTLD